MISTVNPEYSRGTVQYSNGYTHCLLFAACTVQDKVHRHHRKYRNRVLVMMLIKRKSILYYQTMPYCTNNVTYKVAPELYGEIILEVPVVKGVLKCEVDGRDSHNPRIPSYATHTL